MGNCNCNPFGIDRNHLSRKDSRKIVLLLVGLDNSGKTSAAKSLIGEPVDSVVPTVGFSVISLLHRGYSVMIYDLGGGPQIRDIWHRYFTDVHGVIFVIDASDVTRLGEGKAVLTNLLGNEKVAGKPVLVLANKQDCDGALDELDIVEKFDLDALVNRHKCRTLVETCSTNHGKKRHLDPAIHNGYMWLMKSIIDDYTQLNERVEVDMAEQKELDDRKRMERRERIMKLRAERGEVDGVEAQDVPEDFTANPFQPINQLAAISGDTKVVTLDPSLNTRVILVKETTGDRRSSRAEVGSRSENVGERNNSGVEVDRNESNVMVRDSPIGEQNNEASLELKLNRSTSGSGAVDNGVILVKESPRRINNVDRNRTSHSGRESVNSVKRDVRTKSGGKDRVSLLKSAERLAERDMTVGERREKENGGFDYVESGLILVRESPRKIVTVEESKASNEDGEKGRPVVEETSVPARRDPFLVPAQSIDVEKINNVNMSITEFVKDQLELERKNAQRKKRVPLRRANKTAPTSASSESDASRQGSRPGSRENGPSAPSPKSSKSPSSPRKKPTHLPPLKPLNHTIEGNWTLPPLVPNPDLSWAIVTADTNVEKATNHDHKDDSENIVKG